MSIEDFDRNANIARAKWPECVVFSGVIAICATAILIALMSAPGGNLAITQAVILRVALMMLTVVGSMYLIVLIWRDATTSFIDAGIVRWSLSHGKRVFRWENLKRVGGRGHVPRFEFTDASFSVNLFLFRNAQDIVKLIRQHVPEQKISPS
jgi:hypothetical protein